jgi:hypothetical protein
MSKHQVGILGGLATAVVLVYACLGMMFFWAILPAATEETPTVLPTDTPPPRVSQTSIPRSPTPPRTAQQPTATNTPIPLTFTPTAQPPTFTRTPQPPRASPEPTPTPEPPTPTPVPGAGYSGLMKITVDDYTRLRAELEGYGPFWPYGWVTHGQIGNFDSQLAKLEATLGDPNVGKRAILFSCIDDLEAKVSQIPNWIDTVWYTTEPNYTPEYNDIFLENENNSVVRAVVAGHAHGFDVGWGPLPGSFDWHSSIGASDAVLNLLAQVGLDHAYMQYQRRIGGDCPDVLVYGPLAGADTVQEAITHLKQFIPDIDTGCQVAPAGCSQGDALNCGVEHYCREFLVLSERVGMTYAGIWVPDTATIREIRE